MKRFILVGVGLLLLLISGNSMAQLKVGGQFGTLAVTGHSYTHQKDLSGNLIGGHLTISTLIGLDLTVTINYFKKDYEVASGSESITPYEYHQTDTDFSIKYRIGAFRLIPIKPYLGAGITFHYMKSLDKSFERGKGGTARWERAGESGVHVVAGIVVHLPGIPVDIFGEGKYATLFAGRDEIRVTMAYIGASVKLF